MVELIVMDVGHGNCAVLRDEQGTLIFDAGHGATLLQFLEQHGITEIDAILVSHADEDHMAGVLALLSQPHLTVRAMFFNTETLRQTEVWKAFLVALQDARTRHAMRVHVELTTETTALLDRGGVRVEVLAPTPEVAAVGAGGHDLDGLELTPNSMSAVIRVRCNDIPAVLLPGDLDRAGLERLLVEHPEPLARVVVFPHHGARPAGADPLEFATRLCRAVRPDVVIFSIGRGRHATPLPEIIRGVRDACSASRVACTQLSERCAAALPAATPIHLNDQPAKGRAANACCAGTLQIRLGGTQLVYSPTPVAHTAFIEREAPTALCLGRGVRIMRPVLPT